MKLFKIEKRNDGNGQYEDVVIEISEDGITDITNSYGMWIKNSRFELDESNFEKNEDGTFDLTEDYDEKDNLNLLPTNWDLRRLSKNEKDILCELSKYSIDNSDKADSTTVYNVNISLSEATEEGEYFLDIQESEPIVIGKKYTYWDGNNWKDKVLSHEGFEAEAEEVTSDYENWGKKKEIYTSEEKKGTSFSLYILKLDDKNVLAKEEKTRWQGQFNTFSIITSEEEIEVLLASFVDDEIIKENFPLVTEKYGINLRVTDKDYIFSKNDLEFIQGSDPNKFEGVDEYLHTKTQKTIIHHWNRWQGTKDIWKIK